MMGIEFAVIVTDVTLIQVEDVDSSDIDLKDELTYFNTSSLALCLKYMSLKKSWVQTSMTPVGDRLFFMYQRIEADKPKIEAKDKKPTIKYEDPER